MNLFKKMSPKVIAFLIIVYLSLTLIGCPSTPSTKFETDKALIDFNDTLNNTYADSYASDKILLDLFYKNVDRWRPIEFYLFGPGLTLMEKEGIDKLIKEALDILAEDEETLEAVREIRYNRNNIVSELQENANKIKDPSKKLLAQEIADKLREINNLEIEHLKLTSKINKSHYSLIECLLFFLQGKITEEDVQKEVEEVDELLKNKRGDEIKNAIDLLNEEVLDLIEKLESLQMSK